MKKVLITATIASMIDLFNWDNIRILQKLGYEVDVAANFKKGNVTSDERIELFIKELKKANVGVYHIDFSRKPLKFNNHISAFLQLQKLCQENEYSFIHTQTPVPGAITRLVARVNKINVIYMAHGFHFYKGAPILNWLIYYPIEKKLSSYTDVLITINKEDYNNAKKFNALNNLYVPGVGINTEPFKLSNGERKAKKKSLNLSSSNILISVGELNDNKNHKIVIEALSEIKHLDFQYLIVGKGPNESELSAYINENKLTKKIKLLGYRDDVNELLSISNVFIFPSFREGLSKSVMEAMSIGMPILASNIRGNIDLVDDGLGGYLFDPNNATELKNVIYNTLINKDLQKQFSEYNLVKIQDFSIHQINKLMTNVYKNII